MKSRSSRQGSEASVGPGGPNLKHKVCWMVPGLSQRKSKQLPPPLLIITKQKSQDQSTKNSCDGISSTAGSLPTEKSACSKLEQKGAFLI